MNESMTCAMPAKMALDSINCFVAYKRAAGLDYRTEENHYRRLDRFLVSFGCPPNELPKEAVLAWVKKEPNEKALTQQKRINNVRRLAMFMRGEGHDAYVCPKPQAATQGAYVPHIFTEGEMRALLECADRYRSTASSPNLGRIVSLVFRLYYGCGLRASEAMNLKLRDVDVQKGQLFVRDSKFGEGRIVAMSGSVASRCEAFMDELCDAGDDDGWLFRSPHGGAFSANAPYYWFRKILYDAGISHGGKGKGPRLHDIRHTFAAHRLKKWVLEGRDIQSMLPVLSAYMGHCDLRGTQIYLRLTADLFPHISSTMESFFANGGKEAP